MAEESEIPLKAQLIFKLVRRRQWGGKHSAIEDLKKGFPPNAHNEIQSIAEELIRENFFLVKKAFYGTHISLNPKKSKEIKELLIKHYREIAKPYL
ncbi:hypothetical protein KKG83_06880 [Candidatus Micrarchaeota archaeon]|nr:hypothetical protein [Candidatus Micrarchaeota archaeon]MBU2477168.1 hypothetical protein [Candidatus Micrarchaeota archaeon]